MHVNKVLIDKAVKSVGIVVEDHGNSGIMVLFCHILGFRVLCHTKLFLS